MNDTTGYILLDHRGSGIKIEFNSIILRHSTNRSSGLHKPTSSPIPIPTYCGFVVREYLCLGTLNTIRLGPYILAIDSISISSDRQPSLDLHGGIDPRHSANINNPPVIAVVLHQRTRRWRKSSDGRKVARQPSLVLRLDCTLPLIESREYSTVEGRQW